VEEARKAALAHLVQLAEQPWSAVEPAGLAAEELLPTCRKGTTALRPAERSAGVQLPEPMKPMERLEPRPGAVLGALAL